MIRLNKRLLSWARNATKPLSVVLPPSVPETSQVLLGLSGVSLRIGAVEVVFAAKGARHNKVVRLFRITEGDVPSLSSRFELVPFQWYRFPMRISDLQNSPVGEDCDDEVRGPR
jgi:hypothetical protein